MNEPRRILLAKPFLKELAIQKEMYPINNASDNSGMESGNRHRNFRKWFFTVMLNSSPRKG